MDGTPVTICDNLQCYLDGVRLAISMLILVAQVRISDVDLAALVMPFSIATGCFSRRVIYPY